MPRAQSQNIFREVIFTVLLIFIQVCVHNLAKATSGIPILPRPNFNPAPSPRLVVPRQSGSSIPNGWQFFSCFVDNTAAGRLLTTESNLPSNTMTPAECIGYCSANNWSYAGVEYGGECWCDEYLHQVGFQETASSNCDMPCDGDATQTCGGPNLIDVYWNGDFEQEGNPATLSRSFWSFVGCFVDNVSQRTFPAQVQAVGGVYPPSCADACAFYGYTMMGTEYGDECWCGNSTDTASQAPDTDCVMTCSADRDYYCGNANRLSVYQNNPPAETYTNECLAGPLPSWLNVTRLSILASPKEPSTLQTGWNGAVLRIIDVLTVGDTTWSLLSACQNCNITWIDLSFGNNTDPQGFLVPTVPYPEGIQGPNPSPIISIDLHQGESVIFQTEATLPDGYNGYDGYCASESPYPDDSPYSPTNGPIFLGNGHADNWAICQNISASPVNRLDLVFQPVAQHPNYMLEDCIAVDLFLE